MKVDKAIKAVQEAESRLATRLRVVGERHAVEHDLYHLGHTLARQCTTHVERLAPFAERYGAPTVRPRPESPSLAEVARHKGAELLGRHETSGLLLLRDLRRLYLAAQDTEILWIICLQAALAARDAEFADVVTACHEETEAQAKWLRTRIKETTAQVLVAG